MVTTIDEKLVRARAQLDRVPIERLADEVERGALLVDIRPVEQRSRDGEVPGALIIDSNVLFWRLSPTSDARSVDVAPDQRVIVMCNEGYTSSLAAAELQDLGLPRATDLVGGYQAWLAHGGRPA